MTINDYLQRSDPFHSDSAHLKDTVTLLAKGDAAPPNSVDLNKYSCYEKCSYIAFFKFEVSSLNDFKFDALTLIEQTFLRCWGGRF
jgi:hypothetical protein